MKVYNLINVTSKIDVNGNTVYRVKMNAHGFKPKTIKNAYGYMDAAFCFIQANLQGVLFPHLTWMIISESPGFDEKSMIYVVDAGKKM